MVRQLHLGKKQVQWSSHDDMVMFSALLLIFPAFTSVKHMVVGWARRVSANTCLALLCLLDLWLFMCCFVQHNSKWWQMSFVGDGIRYILVICLF